MKAFVGNCWVIFMVIIWKRIARQLHRIILLHLGRVTFRIHFRRTRNPGIVMVFGFFGSGPYSQKTILFIFGDTRIPQTIRGKSQFVFDYSISANINKMKSNISILLERWGPIIADDPSYEFFKVLNTGSIASNKHEMHMRNMRPTSFKKHIMYMIL